MKYMSLHPRSGWETTCDAKLDLVGGKCSQKSHRIGYSVLDQHRTLLPSSKLELFMEDLRTSDLSSHRIPPPPRESWRTLCCGIVCEDYHCIPRGYRLVQMFTVDKCWVWWELKFNRVRNSNVSLNHRMQSAKSLAITMLTFFPLATTIGYKNHTTNIAAGFQCSTLCITRKVFLEKIRSGPVRRFHQNKLSGVQPLFWVKGGGGVLIALFWTIGGATFSSFENSEYILIYLWCYTSLTVWLYNKEGNKYVSLRLRVQNAVSAQPCVGKLGISLVLLNFLHCNFRLWFKTP